MTDPVDELLDEARAWTPSSEETHAVVRSTVAVHTARTRTRRAQVLAAVLGGVALIATGTLALRGRDGTHPGEPVQLGPSVTMVAAPRTSVVLTAQTETLTALELEAGTVALELHHPVGRAAQVLRVRAHDVEVRATGTVFAVTVRASGEVQVITRRGEVEVRTSSRSWSVGEGQAWPAGATWSEVAALFEALEGHALLSPRARVSAMPPPDVATTTTSTSEASTPQPRAADAPRSPTPAADDDLRGSSPSAHDAPDAATIGVDAATEDAGRDESPEGRWQRARLLRAQGDPASALEDLSALVAARDPTWSPMALLESMRIYESVTGAPERVLELGLEFARDHRRHSLWPEARKMTCRAAEQLDRDDVDVCQDER